MSITDDLNPWAEQNHRHESKSYLYPDMLEVFETSSQNLVTDEFPNAAHMGIVGDILRRRDARNVFWNNGRTQDTLCRWHATHVWYEEQP